jgi:glycine/D-amino acid oxidase-like deaminating enzyme
VALSPGDVRARCASPLFRGGALYAGDATVQPARLALGLRARCGARVFERSRVRRLREHAGGVEAETATGRVRAARAVLAVNAAARGVAPLRGRLAVASSHIALTEPVPDVLEAIGWTGGEAISDARTFLHYLRATRDGRIAFGWAGGRIACGARLGGRIEADPDVAAAIERRAVATFPALAGRRFTHAWGGPIDVAPDHVPRVGLLGARTAYAAGFTGNGVGPGHLAGRVLASLALDARDDASRLAIVEPPPVRVPGEPLAWLGGSAVRAATLRRERLEESGRPVDPLTRLAVAAPRALGLHMGRG